MNTTLKVPPPPGNNRTIIIGAGIVGSALAYFLSQNPQSPIDRQIILLDKSFAPLQGSTAHAPGFVGRYNESTVLTSLAVDSVEEYLRIPGGFDQVGGLEVAGSDEGVARLRARCENARKAGLEARLLGRDEIREVAGDLVRLEGVSLGLLFPRDGVAEAGRITRYYQEEARDRGVVFVEAALKGLKREGRHVAGVETSIGVLEAETVVIATGIWAESLLRGLETIPIFPVAHPYMYGEERPKKAGKTPWVRWPEHHFYARDHGNRVGCGSYDHVPVLAELGDTAIGNWLGEFEVALEKGCRLFPVSEEIVAKEKFNGIFAMTPDNLPLAGRIHTLDGGLFIAAAVWVTQAAGVARFIAKQLFGQDVDTRAAKALDPNRFQGRATKRLREEALNGYNDIYKTQADED
jgi:glycine/D-amino acid oxidase-like deaminating enzyme